MCGIADRMVERNGVWTRGAGCHLKKARESREGAADEDRDAAGLGNRVTAAWESSPSRAATVAGRRPSLYRRITTSMMVFQPERTRSPYLQIAHELCQPSIGSTLTHADLIDKTA